MASPFPAVEVNQHDETPPALNQTARLPSRPPSRTARRPPSPLPPVEPPSRAATPLPRPAQPQPRRRLKRHETAQASIDTFWTRFTAPRPSKPFTVLPNNPHAALLAQRAGTHPHLALASKSALASYAEARAACESKVAKIVQECQRLNVKYRDPHFDIEDDFRKWMAGQKPHADCLMGLDEREELIGVLRPLSVKRVEDVFENPQFFIDGATASDVRQGKEGDCWFMSALCTLSNKEGLIQQVCVARDEKVGVYGFVFHRDGEWISEVIDDKLYLIKEDFDDSLLERNRWLELQNRTMPADEWKAVMQTGSRALYFAQCSSQDETWLPLLEKAFAKSHGDYSALESGFVGEGIEDLTGGVTTELFSTDILDKDKFWRDELMNVNKQFLFGCGQMNGAYGTRRGIIEKHAYSIMEAREVNGVRLVKLRNPWGSGGEWQGAWSDGSAEWTGEWLTLLNHKFGDDGVFWISYQDLLRNYQHFDRTRLFGPEWIVTQRWTSVEVPWSVDYLDDPKFRIIIPEAGPVVIVLSQLDDRYFRGLEGQYEFHLQFRLHKDDEYEYIVRSNKAYYMKRSVSTELDLEAGVYWVLLKITAKRFPDAPTVEEVIAKSCQARREKLLSVGLSYDMAHAKGEFSKLWNEKNRQEKLVRRERRKAMAKKMHEARTQQRKKQKLRAMKLDMKKQLKLTRQANEAAARIQAMNIQSNGVGLEGQIEPDALPRPAVRRDTLTVHPHPRHYSTFPTFSSAPDIRVRRPSISTGKLTLNDVSSDELSWDSDIDAPEDSSDEAPDYEQPPKKDEKEEEDEFEKDPWNAVCVVGLRVFSQCHQIEIEVVRGEDGAEVEDSISPVNDGRKRLDVDDSAKDSVEANSPLSPTPRGWLAGLDELLSQQ